MLRYITLALAVSCALLCSAHAAEFWVAPGGSDANPGTREAPLASIELAQKKARELRRLASAPLSDPVKIILRDGVYPLSSPLFFRPEDSGTEASPTVMTAAPGEHPVLSGGVTVTGWHRPTEKVPGLSAVARRQVWVADAPRFGGRLLEFRQLWVNGQKAVRACEPNGDNLNRLLGWDPTNQVAWIPASLVKNLHDPSRLELVMHQQWEIAVLRVKSLRVEGEAAAVSFQEPEGGLEFAHPYPAPVMSTNGNAPFFLANQMEFLDTPGEWYQDLPGGQVYYWPRPGEDLTDTNTQVIAPALETVLQVAGTRDRPVTHLQFQGLAFEHTTWMRPAQAGLVPLQAGMYLLDAYRLKPKGTPERKKLDNQAWVGRPPGAVSVSEANRVVFERCEFTHLASAGLDFPTGTHDDLIEGCVFSDIGGNGLQMGQFSEPGREVHEPWLPADERELCQREMIANNLVDDCANEDWGCVGLAVGYGRHITIAHNEVRNVSYTGISVGWGWTKATNALGDNLITANHVHDVATRMCDTGGIYLLSAQPDTVVSENCVHSIQMSPYVFDPEHWFYLYLDEGSSFITVRDNWCPEARFLKNANGPGNVWTNNGPMVSETIKTSAGLEAPFRDLLR